MKIAVLGTTLQAVVMSAILSESGHSVEWYPYQDDFDIDILNLDNNLKKKLIDQQFKRNLKIIGGKKINYNFEVYLFAFLPSNLAIALSLAANIKDNSLIKVKLMINSSTFGLYGTYKLKEILPSDHWVYLPDMTQDGRSVESIVHASSIVIGIEDEQNSKAQIQEFLRPYFPRKEQFIFMPILDAEFTKLSITGMLATRISYINDLAIVAEKLGIDIESVRQGMSADSRIGESYLYPGAGFGGENFSHDIQTLTHTVSGAGANSQLLTQVWEINEEQKEILFRKLWNYFHGELNGKTVAIWGAAFKEKTSSTKQSPIHAMLAALWAQGVKVKLHDPQALDEIKKIYGERPDLIYCTEQYEAVQDAHALCLLTAWKQYWSPSYTELLKTMHHPLILDGRNIYDPAYVKSQGFAYMGVGR